MRTLVVPAPMLGLDAERVGEVVARSWGEATGRPGDVVVAPTGRTGRTHLVPVADPWGRQVPASVLLQDDTPTGPETGPATGPVAVLDTAAAAGPALRRPGDDPARASSAGVGELVLAAVGLGARRVVVPLEGLACHDGGAGLVATLAGTDHGPADLDGADVEAARERLRGVTLVGSYEDPGPLLGLQGASAVQGPGKGMDPAAAQDAEGLLGRLVDRLRREVPEPTDLLTGTTVRRDRAPGAGAGGGLGHGVLLLGGRLEEDAPARAAELGLPALVARADLVVTCTDRFDWRVLRSSLPKVAAELAAPLARPVVLLAGEGEAGRREAMALGLSGLYEVVESHRARRAVLADPVTALAARVARVARTWQPRPVE